MKFKHLLPLLLSAVLSAQAYALTEGEDYLVLDKPIPQEQPGKIEVLEFFGYFCVHCHHFDPLLLKLGKALPSDTYLRTEHVVWRFRNARSGKNGCCGQAVGFEISGKLCCV